LISQSKTNTRAQERTRTYSHLQRAPTTRHPPSAGALNLFLP